MDKQVKIKYGYLHGTASFWVVAKDIDCAPIVSPSDGYLEVVLKKEKSFRAVSKNPSKAWPNHSGPHPYSMFEVREILIDLEKN